jgi:hypothetical protein
MIIGPFQAYRSGQGQSRSERFEDLTALPQMPTILWHIDGHHVCLYMDHGNGLCPFHLENTPILPSS